MNSNLGTINSSSAQTFDDDKADEEKTSDIFGKHLRQFKLLPG